MGRRPLLAPQKIIQVGTVSTSTAPESGTTITFSHTVDDFLNRGIMLFVNLNDQTLNITSLTYGGVDFTFGFTQSFTLGALDCKQQFWYLLGPAVGTANIVITVDATLNQTNHSAATAVTLGNIGTNDFIISGGTPQATNAIGGTSSTLSITTTSALALVFDFMTANANPNIVADATQTQLANFQFPITNTAEYNLSYKRAPMGLASVSMSDTWTGSQDNGQMLIAIRRA